MILFRLPPMSQSASRINDPSTCSLKKTVTYYRSFRSEIVVAMEHEIINCPLSFLTCSLTQLVNHHRFTVHGTEAASLPKYYNPTIYTMSLCDMTKHRVLHKTYPTNKQAITIAIAIAFPSQSRGAGLLHKNRSSGDHWNNC